METHQIVRLLFDSLALFATFVVMIAATVLVFLLWKRKQGGVAGAIVLMLARTGVWITMLGFLVANLLYLQMGFELAMWIRIALRVVLLFSTVMTIGGLLLIKPAKSVGTQGVSHG